MICSNDGRVKFYLESIFNKIGETMIDDYSDVILIQDDLVDCINMDKFNTNDIRIFVGDKELDEEECNHDCSNCTLHDDDEDYEKELEAEDLGLVLTEELLDSLSEIDANDVESIVEMIANKINEAFEIGYNEALEDAEDELQDSIDAIRSLRFEE